MNTKELGDFGEQIACEYLVGKGFKILGRNYGIKFGEIDIIARKKRKFFSRRDKVIHFIEVKTLKQTTPQAVYPEEHVDFRKQRKLAQLAQIWLEKNNYKQNQPYQIDIAGILVNEITKQAKLHYFSNVVK